MTNNPTPNIHSERPMVARAYGWALGDKDNFQADRELVLGVHERFPQMTDIARQNRRFLYRAVRYLAADAGITQFLDLGSGLPTSNNVHQVAQEVTPQARVVYVDNDPLVAAHGQALLADNANTTVITADMTQPEQILEHPDTQRLIDFTRPVAVLMFSIPHCIPGDEDARRAVQGPMTRVVPGSYLAISHVVADTEARAAELTETVTGLGMAWKTRTPHVVEAWVRDLEPVEPGLCDIDTWQPMDLQPDLAPPPAALNRYVGASRTYRGIYEYGGVARSPNLNR